MEKPGNTFTRTIFLLFLLSFELLFGFGNSATDSCSNNVDLSKLVGFSTTSLDCQSIWTSQDFILRYGNESGTWNFLLSAPSTTSYVAIGFSKDGLMVGSSAMVGWVGKDGTSLIKQYLLGGRDPSLVYVDKGDLPLVNKSAKAIVKASRIYLAFQLSKPQSSKQVIYSVGPPGFIPKSPGYQLQQHLFRGVTSVNYTSGSGNSPPPAGSPADSQADTCTNNVDFSKLAGFETASLKCQSVWASQSFILRYGNVGNTWSFLLSAPEQSSYVAIGFSSNGLMVGSSAMVGWSDSSSGGMIKQYSLGGKDSSQVNPGEGKLPLVSNSSKVFTQSSRIYLAFQLSTSQPSSHLIYAVGPSGVLPKSPHFRLTYHSDKDSTNMDYASGSGNSPPPTGSPADTQGDTCTNNVDFSKLAGFETASLKCQSVWATQSFILRYGNVGNTWSFLLSAPEQSSYVAIGFSSNGLMVGSSAMVGWSDSSSGGMIKQYSLGGKDSSQVNPGEGKLPLVSNSSKVFTQSSRIYLAFQLSTSQPSSHLIYAVGPSGVLPKSPDFRLTYHSDKDSTNMDYASGQVQTQKTPYQKLKRAHGGINIFAWGIMMPIGAIVARYFKRYDPTWFYSHIAIQITAFLLGILGVIQGLILQNRINTFVTHHKGLGIAILVFACLQVTALFARPKKDAKYRRYWNWYHHYGGRTLIILAVANIFYGIDLADESSGWTVGYAIVLTFIVIGGIFLQVKKMKEDH